MRLILYGTEADREEFMCSVTALPDLRYRKMQVTDCKDVPVLWFSDDNGFGVQSYRLGCAYFHKKPVSPQVLSAAIARCV